MRRKQLYLDEEVDDALRVRSAETGLSEAEHVRRALRRYLFDPADAQIPNPLTALIGLVPDDDAPADLAEELDHYAYGVPKGHKTRT